MVTTDYDGSYFECGYDAAGKVTSATDTHGVVTKEVTEQQSDKVTKSE